MSKQLLRSLLALTQALLVTSLAWVQVCKTYKGMFFFTLLFTFASHYTLLTICSATSLVTSYRVDRV